MYWLQMHSLTMQKLKSTSFWYCGTISNRTLNLSKETRPNGVIFMIGSVDMDLQDVNPATYFKCAGYLDLLNLTRAQLF
jgi:hypothetical protein